MDFLDFYGNRFVLTLITLALLFLLRFIVYKTINKVATKWERIHTRTSLIKKFVNYILAFLLIVFMPLIWGFQPKDVTLFLSSIFAVIGIAFFAQWSILSNITSGIIMFFTFPYRIGDFIKIHEGEDSIYGYIEDIRTFQVIIRSLDNSIVTFPNSMMLQKGVSILDTKNIEEVKKIIERKAKEEDDIELKKGLY